MSGRSGRVRVARLTDLAALGELSRLCQQESAETRSLGLPVSGPRIGVFSLFRLPLGAFRPHDLLYVYEGEDGLSGLIRVERDTARDEWTIVELDAIGLAEAGDIRFRLVQHILRDGSKRGAIRFHVACADAAGNVELFMQAGFARYGEELLLYRPPGSALPEPWSDERATGHGDPPGGADRRHRPRSVVRGGDAPAGPAAGGLPARRLGAPGDGLAGAPLEPRPDPPLRRRRGIRPRGARRRPDGTQLDALLQVGVAKEDQPHYLKIMARPDADTAPLVEYGLGVISARTRNGGRSDHGVIAPVRTYEAPIDRRLEEAGFGVESTVTLLMKETVVRVAEPALVPAIR